MNAAATPDSAAAADRLTCHVSDPLISGAQRRRTQRRRTDGRRTVAQEKWGRRRIRSRTLDDGRTECYQRAAVAVDGSASPCRLSSVRCQFRDAFVTRSSSVAFQLPLSLFGI